MNIPTQDQITIPLELAEAALDDMISLRGEWHWWQDELRCNYQRDYNLLCDDSRGKQVGRSLTRSGFWAKKERTMWIKLVDYGVLIDTDKAFRILRHDEPHAVLAGHVDYFVVFEQFDGNERDLECIDEQARDALYDAIVSCLMSGDPVGKISGKILK